MNLSDINNLSLDPSNIGSWPLAARVIVILLLCGTILFAGYYLGQQNHDAPELAAQNLAETVSAETPAELELLKVC